MDKGIENADASKEVLFLAVIAQLFDQAKTTDEAAAILNLLLADI